MLLGTGKVIITPAQGTWLAGYSNGRGADSVLHELQLRAFWFQESPDSPAQDAVCLITAEILGFSTFLTGTLRNDLAEHFGLRPEAIMLAASHTHSGPQTCENMPHAGGPLVPEYVATLRRLTLEAVSAARATLSAVDLRIGRGQLSHFAISRRLVVDGKAAFAPSPDGPRDEEVTALIASDVESDAVKAVLFHYTCHPTLIGGPYVSGDYPGVALEHVETQIEGACAAFLPGCFGDVRPNATFVGGQKFRTGTPADVQEFGTALGAEVVRIVAASSATPPLHPHLAVRASVLDLPLQNGSETRPLAMQTIELAQELGLVAMGAEMGVEYGFFVKALDPEKSWLPVAYSNGLIGYICPAHQYDEGGYEPFGSCEVYSLPAPFKPESEALLHAEIWQLTAQTSRAYGQHL